MDHLNVCPCKVSYNNNNRRFLITRPAAWTDFETKIRTVFTIPHDVALDVQYKDEDGDVITLNTNSELDDVLATHALFSQTAPVKFEVLTQPQKQQEQPTIDPQDLHLQLQLQPQPQPQSQPQLQPQPSLQPLYHSVTSEGTSTSIRSHDSTGSSNNVIPSWPQRRHDREDLSSTVTSDSLNSMNRPPRQRSNSLCVSENSEDGMLVSIDDDLRSHLDDEFQGVNLLETSDQVTTYPQGNPVLAAELQERLESYKLDAPVFRSSLSRKHRVYIEDEKDADADPRSIEQNTSCRNTYPSAMEATLRGDMSATVCFDRAPSTEHHVVADVGTLHSRFENMNVTTAPVIMHHTVASVVEQHAQDLASSIDVFNDAQEEVEPSEADPSELSVLPIPTATTPAGECHIDADEQELIAMIRHDPQLVVLISRILSKILSKTQVNVQAFADFLLTQAQLAAQTTQSPTGQASTQATHANDPATPKVVTPVQDLAAKSGDNRIPSPRHPYSPIHHHHHGGHHRPAGSHQSHHGYGPTSTSKTPMQSSPMMSLMHPTPSFAAPPIPTLPPMPQLPSMPTMPELPSMPTMPELPMATATSLGRSNTIHSSRPSPIGSGSPFGTMPPMTNGTSHLMSDRATPERAEVDRELSTASRNGKAKATDDDHFKMNSGSSGASESSSSPWTRGNSGWVWTGIVGEKAEAEEASSNSHYESLREDQSTPTSSSPEHPVLGSSRGHSFRHFALTNDHFAFNTDGAETSEGLRRRQTMHEYSRLADRKGRTAHQSDELDAERARERLQQDIEQRHQALVEQQKALEKLRLEQVQQAGVRPRPISHFGPIPLSSYSFSNNNNRSTGIRSSGSAQSITAVPRPSEASVTPVDAPRVSVLPAPTRTHVTLPASTQARPLVAAPISSSARTTAVAVPAPSSARTTAAAPAPVPAPSPARTPAPVTGDRSAAMHVRTTPASITHQPAIIAPVRVEANPSNPFADPELRVDDDFEQEIRTLVAMGFEDNAQLRQIVRDNGGEIEAIVDLMVPN